MSVIEQFLVTLQREDDFLCALATTDSEGLPHVRYMKGVIDERLIIRCPTFVSAEKVQQIRQCANVSITCGDTDSSRPGVYFQIAAKATISQSHDDRMAAWTPRIEKWFHGPTDDNYAVVRIDPLCIHMFPIAGGPEADIWTV